jgi:hypothetical protein
VLFRSIGFNSQVEDFTGTRILTINDLGKILLITGAWTISVPSDSTEPGFAVGDRVDILQTATVGSVVTITNGSGATLSSESSKNKLNGQYAAATLIKTAANTWVLIGNITS